MRTTRSAGYITPAHAHLTQPWNSHAGTPNALTGQNVCNTTKRLSDTAHCCKGRPSQPRALPTTPQHLRTLTSTLSHGSQKVKDGPL